jgi:hypothetical protein
MWEVIVFSIRKRHIEAIKGLDYRNAGHELA